MNTETIDSTILVTASIGWQKVAMIISRVADAVPDAFTEGEDEFELIASRIDALIASGHLLVDGDTSDWRSSEVKIP